MSVNAVVNGMIVGRFSIVPSETIYGYVLKSNPADIVARAAHAVFIEDQCWSEADNSSNCRAG